MLAAAEIPLTDDERDALTAARDTALVLVGDEFRSLCRMSIARYPREAVEKLVADRLLFWRVPNEVAEMTFRGKGRLEILKSRAKNAARFADLARSLGT